MVMRSRDRARIARGAEVGRRKRSDNRIDIVAPSAPAPWRNKGGRAPVREGRTRGTLMILGAIGTLAAIGLAAALLVQAPGSPDDPRSASGAPRALPSGRSYAVRDGIDLHQTRPLWELATLAGVPQSCGITRTWTVRETTRGSVRDNDTFLLLCPKRGFWVLTYDQKQDKAGSAGPFASVAMVEEMIDPGGSVTWDGPRPLDMRTSGG